MKFHRITIRDFQAVKHIDLVIDRPVVLIAGPNEQGKSSIADAIRLALAGDSERAPLKKDWPALVRDGAPKGAAISIEGDEWRASVALPGGATKHERAPRITESVVSSLSPPYFASLTPEARRAFLFPLLGISANPETILARAIERGANEPKLRMLSPLIGRAPWEDIEADAKARATKAKGAWEAATGEKWGAKKAEAWRPPAPPAPPEGTPAEESAAIEAIDAQMVEAHQAIGAANVAASMLRTRSDRIAALDQAIALTDRRAVALAAAQSELAAINAAISQMGEIAEGPPPGTDCACPACGAMLLLKGGVLHQRPAAPQHTAEAIAEAQAKLARLRESRAMLERSVANAQRDLAACQDAAVERERLMGEEMPVAASDATLESLRARLDELLDRRRTHESRRLQMDNAERARAAVAKQAQDARAANSNVEEWLAIAATLAPSGIPGELLNEGLSKLNAQLQELAALTGWDAPSVRDDMALIVGHRPYRLGSVSARYRADVLCAIAIAILSGVRMLVLDGIEVLVGPQRVALLRLMHHLATTGALDTAILIGTLKERPAALPNTYRTVWIEGGEVVPEPQAEKVAA